jgi:polyisoprenoid-binding protein YceI
MMSATTASPEQQVTARRWTVDPARSTVEFRVRTFWGLSTVSGHFDHFDGFYTIGADGPEVELTIDADSLDTGNKSRDKHLRSADFFSVAEHPQVRYTATRIVDAGNGTLNVTGELEAAGQTIPLTLPATSREDGDELEIEATTVVDQRQLGMTHSPLGMLRSPSTLHVKARLTQ